MAEQHTPTRGRPKTNATARDRRARLAVLESGLRACYEIIDGIRTEIREIESADRAAIATTQTKAAP